MGLRTVLLTGCVFAVAGCAGQKLDRVADLEPQGSEFNRDLYGGYVDLSKAEFDEADYRDSDTFAERALVAATGSRVEPEPIDARSLPAENVGELSDARARLVAALDGGARDKFPDKAAMAQVQFECWMQEQEENFQPDDIAACQSGFLQTIATLEDGLKPDPVAAAPAPVPEPQSQTFLVMFDFDDANLDDAANAKLQSVLAYAASIDDAKIEVGGHADRAGETDYNASLAALRADVVADALAKAGLDEGSIRVASFGENQPAVPTPDGAPSRENRRVEITISQ